MYICGMQLYIVFIHYSGDFIIYEPIVKNKLFLNILVSCVKKSYLKKTPIA